MHLIYGIIGTTSCSRIGDTKNPASILILLHIKINLEQIGENTAGITGRVARKKLVIKILNLICFVIIANETRKFLSVEIIVWTYVLQIKFHSFA